VQILANTGGIASTNCYLVADEQAKQAVLFDAPNDTVAPLLDEAGRRGWDVIGLWLTHGHFDHIADHSEVSRQFPDAKVLIHRLDDPKLHRPNSMAMLLPFKIAPRRADDHVDDRQRLKIGSIDVEVIHTPGHSPGHVMYHLPTEQILIGGDLIICGAVGRTDFPDSNSAALDASIRRVMQLPPDTRLLPGHCEASTLGHERQTNPYVQQALDESTPRER
jgi:glyoxylase-like metal-dependent hydrolase (beta-lactamase superfamily II)